MYAAAFSRSREEHRATLRATSGDISSDTRIGALSRLYVVEKTFPREENKRIEIVNNKRRI